MRFITPSILAILLALAVTLSTAQLADSVSEPFQRPLDSFFSSPDLLNQRSLLEARQSSSNSTSTSPSPSSSSSAPDSTASGSAPPGGEATITESTCSMTTRLSVNQQASWGNGFVNTCCGFATGTQCWYRNQNMVEGKDECEIPDCADLQSEDKTRMIGFIPLSSTNGSGKYANIFLSLGMLSAGMMTVPGMGMMLAVAVAVTILGFA
ncbi:hypothetical protein NDA11_002373 [Ustilago hordei]|uniref:Uncharacterized protein n=1 Tax=Ustilago hordei TaxID=120017 RepID=I2G1S8_USTHO|nr:uncharacterized protein UHO2_02408 [Ustilago hordei]KAJ1040074.1 hypothetical protein NDA10_003237 [Ustilago hordei]KAJ1584935.1 hypothetical protein NDA15_001076 [Ustilago hordei]KAJ1587783.1 hypothetical protein NDA12_000674 [Ustilago hordei]KAJ1592846.1 hypothetical protein NDA11_002373 [Ustilago hordei]KAJ1601783.1 hypothetical protein NDA14_006472 [Ustilago hordei]